jgi:hypothetical protein
MAAVGVAPSTNRHLPAKEAGVAKVLCSDDTISSNKTGSSVNSNWRSDQVLISNKEEIFKGLFEIKPEGALGDPVFVKTSIGR